MQHQQEETTKTVERLEKNVGSTRSRPGRVSSDEYVERMARDLDHQLARSVNQIGREYNRNYYYTGQRFAEGDGKLILCSSDAV